MNGAEIREIPVADAASGNPLVWKLAMWGSDLDGRLLNSIGRRFESLEALCQRAGLKMHQGMELRQGHQLPPAEPAKREAIEHIQELIGKNEIVTAALKRRGRIYSFPSDAMREIQRSRSYVRVRSGIELPLAVSRPPHVIVDAARRFAVYSESFIAVPPRWVGIAGNETDKELLKALSLYIVSDFGYYHQFMLSPQMGVYKARADLKTLKQLPVPISNMEKQGLARWADLHRRLAEVQTSRRNNQAQQSLPYSDPATPQDISPIEAEVNSMTYEALRLRPHERLIVSDFIQYRLLLNQGKVPRLATEKPSEVDLRLYCEVLKGQLDAFFDVATKDRHNLEVVYDDESAMVVADRGPALPAPQCIRIIAANDATATALKNVRDRLEGRRRQWLYFHRDLRKYQNGTSYLFKPMQRIHWLRSQALIDAREVFADKTEKGEP